MNRTSQYAIRYYKEKNFVADLEDNRLFINEDIYSAAVVMRDQIYTDSNYIPIQEPGLAAIRALADREIYSDPIMNYRVIQCFKKLAVPRRQATSGFYSVDLRFCMPRNFADNKTYIYHLYYLDSSSGTYKEIPFSSEWIIDLFAGVIRFYSDDTTLEKLTHGSSTLYIDFYKYVGRFGAGTSLLEQPSTRFYGSGVYWPEVGLEVGETLTEAFTIVNDRLHSVLTDLIPLPAQITTTALPMTLYSGRKAGSQNDSSGLVVDVFYGNNIELSGTSEFQVFLGNELYPVIVDSEGSHDGTSLTIVSGSTPTGRDWRITEINSYKTNMYYTIKALMTPTVLPYSFPQSNSNHYSITLVNYTKSTSSISRTFYVQNSYIPTVSSAYRVSNSDTYAYVSGVKCFAVGHIINIRIIGKATDLFYNATSVGGAITRVISQYPAPLNDTTTNLPESANALPPTTETGQGDTITLDTTITIPTNIYCKEHSYDGFMKNVAGVKSDLLSLKNLNTSSTQIRLRCDTVSVAAVESSLRVKSGSGQFPSFGETSGDFGGAFDSTESLITSGNEELQMIKRYFVFPYQVDYRGFDLTYEMTNVDYSSISGGSYNTYRWVTFGFTGGNHIISNTIDGLLENAISINLKLINAYNFGSSIITSGILIYLIIIDSNGDKVISWIDGNKAYEGFGTPGSTTTDGDAFLDLSKTSSPTDRIITFGGQVLSGKLYVRIGLPSGSDKTFYDISISQVGEV